MIVWCWGFGWGDDVIDVKICLMMNLLMIGVLGKMYEWEFYCQGVINNGVMFEEICVIIYVIVIYCGVFQVFECFCVVWNVLGEIND